MLFFSFFKTLVGKELAVELKNDVVITGTLMSVDQYLNIKLNNINVLPSFLPCSLSCLLAHVPIYLVSHSVIDSLTYLVTHTFISSLTH